MFGIVLRFFSSFKNSHNNLLAKKKGKNSDPKKKNVTFSSLGEVLGKSIMNSISTILMIGGFVVVFSVVLSILNQTHLLDGLSHIFSPVFSFFHVPLEFAKPFLSGIIELTNGVNLVAAIPVKMISISIILCAFLLGFGGISVLLQVFSIIAKNGLSIKTYFIGKLLQGCFAALYTYFTFVFLPFLQFNL